MKALSIVFIAIVLLSSIIGVATVVTANTIADDTCLTLDSANIYRMVEASAMDKESTTYATNHDSRNCNVQSIAVENSIVSEVVFN